MRALEEDLNNPYDDPKIIDKKMDIFAGVVVDGLTAINGSGDYTDVIADVVNARAPFHLNITSLATDFIIGKGKTELRVGEIEAFKEFVRNNKGMVTAKYFKLHHDFYLEFYPYELEDFNGMNKTNALLLITRYATAAHTHVADFTPQFDTDATAHQTAYTTAASVQNTSKNTIGSDRSGRDNGRKALNIAVYGAYNFTKYKTKCDYDTMHTIFPLETLFRHGRKNIKHIAGTTIALGTTNIAQAIYDESAWITLHNSGTADQRIGLELTEVTPAGTTLGKVIKAGKTKSFEILKLGIAGNNFLNITNLNLTDGGSWKADIYEEE